MPPAVLDWGLVIIRRLQQLSPALDVPFRALTVLGSTAFVVAFVALLYWAVDRRVAVELSVVFILSSLANLGLKTLLQQPRPGVYDTSITVLATASGYGLPSGHTQTAVVLWGYVAWRWRRLRWLCGALLVLVPLSRVYLGVHFPTDLLGGYLVGGAALCLCLARFSRSPIAAPAPRWSLALALVGAGLAAATPFLPQLAPYLAMSAGAAVGLGLGLALERAWVCFQSGGALPSRVLRALLGLAALAALYQSSKLLPSSLQAAWPVLLVQFFLLGLLLTWGAPALFVRLGLATPSDR